MGYAATIPYALIQSRMGGSFTNALTLTNAAADYALGTVVTIDYKQPINLAYAELYLPVCQDTSGALNYFNQAGGGYLLLDDGVTTKSAGFIWNYYMMAPANGFSVEQHVYLDVDLSSYLKPNTTYTCTIKDGQCVGNNLILRQPRVILTLIGGI